jgi:hypothetical protein
MVSTLSDLCDYEIWYVGKCTKMNLIFIAENFLSLSLFSFQIGGALDTETEEFLNYFTPLAQWLGSANSCINPVLYAFNEKYRRGFIAIIQSRSCWGRLRFDIILTILLL